MSIRFDIPNEEISRAIKDLSRFGERGEKIVEKELNRSGIRIETASKQKITEFGHIDTARLRSSIHFESELANRSFTYSDETGRSFDGKLDVDPKDLEVYVGTNVEYAEKIRQINDYLFPPAENERAKLLAQLKSQFQKL